MTGAFEVVWSADATAAWERLSYAEAEAIAVAVHRFATGGPCTVIAGEGGTYLLLVGEFTVVMLIDGNTLHVWRLRHT
jgi:hypothetical protein